MYCKNLYFYILYSGQNIYIQHIFHFRNRIWKKYTNYETRSCSYHSRSHSYRLRCRAKEGGRRENGPRHRDGRFRLEVVRSISEISSCFFGPRPWHIEIQHRVKKTSTIDLFGSETLRLKIRRLKLWKLTVGRSIGDLWAEHRCVNLVSNSTIRVVYSHIQKQHKICFNKKRTMKKITEMKEKQENVLLTRMPWLLLSLLFVLLLLLLFLLVWLAFAAKVERCSDARGGIHVVCNYGHIH